ncbi:hypothetical protein OSH11_11060 [Kaistia dalseonensis]|uniref:Cation transporter n=1 Tax=Kaistia dalseonensis TaxID=410840 RepID=A0ABU0H7F5_9HYPH|nr:hypothetical protein [Kaistia dalseonensis]MCX5495247.1 hypothetical protein [Kaistia dalseonensis]MDQ0437833.1 hypothetical protein [Kaistia dalseonensis]
MAAVDLDPIGRDGNSAAVGTVALTKDGAHGHHHEGHGHHDEARARPVRVAAKPSAKQARPSLFLASALDRLLVAVVLSGLLWIAVFWATA